MGPSGLSNGNSLTLTQTVPTCIGKNYTISYDYKTDGQSGIDCSLNQAFNSNYCVSGMWIQPGQWTRGGYAITAKKTSTTLDFQLDCRNSKAHVQIDNVVFKEYNGPVGCSA